MSISGVPAAGRANAPDAVIVIDVHVERLRARRITSSKHLLAMAVVDGEGILALHARRKGKLMTEQVACDESMR